MSSVEKELPDFDHLKHLAETAPDKLEAIRKEYSDYLIQNAPERCQRMLNGLQFKINMVTRRSPNAVNSCIAMSRMMLDSFNELHTSLTNPNAMLSEKPKPLKNNLIPFPTP